MRRVLLMALVLLAAGASAQESVKPIRGAVPIPESNPSEGYRIQRNDRLPARGHDWEPPVIPHNVKGYQITRNVNTCMVCHSRAAALQSGATPVRKSHYVDREGKAMQTVSARRYFCLQCHVSQSDADPLVPNSFKGPQ